MRLNRIRLEAVLVAGVSAALAGAGCKYGYDNPAERLRPGLVTGRTVADPAAQGTLRPTGGIGVSLKGGAFDQVSHASTGRFGLLPLPAGEHTLLFRHDAQLARTRRVRVELGADGQPGSVELGDVDVPFAGVIDGTLSDDVHGGVVVDETTGLTSPAGGGAYRVQAASLGDHRIKAGLVDVPGGEAWVGGPIELTLGDEAQSSVTRAARLAVHAATGVGRLRVQVVSLHPDIAPADVGIVLDDYVHGPLPAAPAPDGRGVVELDVPEGVYWIRMTPPAAHAAEVTLPSPPTAVVIQGEVAEVGSLYLVPPGLAQAAQARCTTDAECPNSVCVAGACLDWRPPPFVPPGLPFCYWRNDFCGGGFPCQAPGGVQGQCFDAGPNQQACVPCGTSCAIFGTAAFQAAPTNPQTGQCP